MKHTSRVIRRSILVAVIAMLLVACYFAIQHWTDGLSRSTSDVVAADSETVSESAGDADTSELVQDVELPRDALRDNTGAVTAAELEALGMHIIEEDGIALYGWSELKVIADGIAEASTDEEGLEIAKFYRLVDSDGKLQGGTKHIILADGTEAYVRIAGFRHDNLADGTGKAGITFEFADAPLLHRMNPSASNDGGWEASEMRAWLNSNFLELMPEDLVANIVEVEKATNNCGEIFAENDESAVTSTTDKIWLLSFSEVYGEASLQQKNGPDWSPLTYDAEGSQYKLYADQDVSAGNYGFCEKGEASSMWWLRSPSAYNSSGFLYVYNDGDWYRKESANTFGVSPGFCF